MNSDRKKSVLVNRWAASNSTMKTPTRPRFTIGGTQVSSSKKNSNIGQARFSIGGVIPASARRHSMFKPTISNVKDTRPLSSKEYQNEMVRRIYEFLLQHDGDNCLSERVIRSPTKQDFICMFESIYQHLSPDFQIRNVIEEVPAIFRGLGYPTAIKPSTMQTIGASHSWPTLLGALTWLIGVVESYNSLQGQAGQNLLLGGDDSDGALKAYKYSWFNAGFKKYQENRNMLDNEIFFDGKVQALRSWFEQQEDFDAQRHTIQATLKQIEEECAELVIDKGKLDSIREDAAVLDKDIKKAECYIKEVEEDVNRLLEQYKMLEAELTDAIKVVDELRAEGRKLEALIKVQEETVGLSNNDARALIAEYDQNKLTINNLESESEDLCKQHWLAVPKSRNAFAEQKTRYHKLLMSLKNLYSVANPEDEFVVDDNAKNEKDLRECVTNVKALTDHIETKFMQRILDIEQLMRQSTSELEVIKQQCSVGRGKLRERERMELRNERHRTRDREEWEKKLIAVESCVDRLENEKEVLENKQHEVGIIRRDIECQRAENAEVSKMLSEKQLQISEAILSRFYIIVSSLDSIKEALQWMIRTMKCLIDLGSDLDSTILED